jgi:hypothetical protein
MSTTVQHHARSIIPSFVRRSVSERLGIDSSGSREFRRRRFRLFIGLVDAVLATRDTCRIIDIGGEPAYWTSVGDLLGSRRCHITLLNMMAFSEDQSRFDSIVGDARNINVLADNSFDIVHSNSVIEHVGRWDDMANMAREVRRLAPSYFVQTPYFWFPVEPHCRTAFFHWLPESIRLRMLMSKPRGNWGRALDVTTAMQQMQSAVLLDCAMMRTLFPDGEIHRERLLGMTKSLIAIRMPARQER